MRAGGPTRSYLALGWAAVKPATWDVIAAIAPLQQEPSPQD